MLKSMLQDGVDGTISSKRVITFLAFMLCSLGFVANLFFGYQVDKTVYDSMMYIVLVGLGVVVAEKFSTHKKD